ncbi:uncharacterized protein CTHT_0013670 [Thermochaetoides thermophila DSM 1495]|uniref:Uncharacterized protein n=1 Tax=Chaetomium thermophilum (strain DSM 1495 / CBS 144.50 / IMI 039719) TaxID=759272 RepID=G0S1I0_CHATD|nr:hypothetical protein CTHT_0013670 [Thermochaetoides thermophila DSM 1495]EGS22890.1 hypothetical protein CTHT_0013670 [Thermochaetoides thermophila DSM 1495]
MANNSVDPQCIWYFLNTYKDRAYEDFDKFHPRSTPLLVEDSVDTQSESALSGTTVTSHANTHAMSLFSSGAHSHDTQSVFTVPSERGAPGSDFDVWWANRVPTRTEQDQDSEETEHSSAEPGPGELWCEFWELKLCRQLFQAEDRSSWIEHHAKHLGEAYPPELFCWFCTKRFKATLPSNPHSLEENFEKRMKHIHKHIRKDGSTPKVQVSDQNVVDHMYRNGWLSEAAFKKARRLPPIFQHPDLCE